MKFNNLKKIKFILPVVLFFISLNSIAQSSGYLGKRNYIQINAALMPSFNTNSEVHQNEVHFSKRIATLAYQFSFNHVFTNNIEISLGYQMGFARGNSLNDDVYFSTIALPLLEDVKFKYNGGFVGLNFYKKGSMAPIGKYRGFIFEYGVSSNTSEEIMVGYTGNIISSGFFKDVREIETQIEYPLQDEKLKTLGFRYRFGRSIPVAKFMTIFTGLSIPLFYYYSGTSYKGFGFNVEDRAQDIDYEDSRDWQKYQAQAIYGLSRISVEGGLRICF